MNKIMKMALGVALLLTLGVSTANADAEKGQKYYMKKLKKACGISGGAMASKHTQEEWQSIQGSTGVAAEIKVICPKVKDSALKDKYLEHYYDFFFEYASDSGNIPAC